MVFCLLIIFAEALFKNFRKKESPFLDSFTFPAVPQDEFD
jgi:hypothetical protein